MQHTCSKQQQESSKKHKRIEPNHHIDDIRFTYTPVHKHRHTQTPDKQKKTRQIVGTPPKKTHPGNNKDSNRRRTNRGGFNKFVATEKLCRHEQNYEIIVMTKVFIAKTQTPIQIRLSNFVPEGNIYIYSEEAGAKPAKYFVNKLQNYRRFAGTPLLFFLTIYIYRYISGQGDCSRASIMDLSNRDIRAMILYDLLGGKSYQESFSSLSKCFGERSPTKSTVTKWYRELQCGRQTVEDNNPCGRPLTAVTVDRTCS